MKAVECERAEMLFAVFMTLMVLVTTRYHHVCSCTKLLLYLHVKHRVVVSNSINSQIQSKADKKAMSADVYILLSPKTIKGISITLIHT